MTLNLKIVGDSDLWHKKIRQARMDALARAYGKLGKKPKVLKVTAPEPLRALAKAKEAETKPAGVSRSTGTGNEKGFACPTCWGVPPNLRQDGFTIARHLPTDPEAKRYRDTEFCDGQGKISVCVMDPKWEQGSEPRAKMSAKKYLQGNGRRKA